VRQHAPSAGGEFDAENDPDEGARARGHPSWWECRSLKRDCTWKHRQQRANDQDEDHRNGRAKTKFGFKLVLVDRRRPTLEVSLPACLLDGGASWTLRLMSRSWAQVLPCAMLSDPAMN
jgi:hypothetical protein